MLECLNLYRRVSQTSPKVHGTDLGLAKKWVEAQDPSLQPFARMLLKRAQFIPITEFREHLIAAVHKLLKEVPKEKIIFTYYNGPGEQPKSGKWVTGMIYEMFPDLRDVSVSDAWDGKRLSEITCKSPPCTYVYIDDASYSADQVKGVLKFFAKDGAKKVALIPYVTNRALKTMAEASPDTQFIYDQKMKTVEEIAAEEGIQIPRILILSSQARPTITFFQHKAGDEYSASSFFKNGTVYQRDRRGDFVKKDPIPFLQSYDPIYRIRDH